MKTEKELLKLQNSSENKQDNPTNNNSSDIKEVYETEAIGIEKTPFTIIRFKPTDEWMISIGNNQVTEKTFKTKRQAIRYIKSKPWSMILNAAIIINQLTKKV